MNLSELERALINAYQGGFPIVEQPFRSAAASLGCDERELLESIKQMLDLGILTRFGPLYDAVRLGGGLTLAAMAVPEAQFDRITAQVNGFAEVAHNYRREHALNMWFVLATGSPEATDTTLLRIERATGLKVYNFPKRHEFYVGLWLALADDGLVTTVPPPAGGATASADCLIDGLDRKIISATQAGLPVVKRPYSAIADQCGTAAETVKQRLQRMLDCGVIRRIGAVPNHYRLGLLANGMTVWDVADPRVMELGPQIAQLDFVSHCYLRPRHLPVWRYNLFAMVHGHTRDEVDRKARRIAGMLGSHCDGHDTLFSTAILKKTGMRMAA